MPSRPAKKTTKTIKSAITQALMLIKKPKARKAKTKKSTDPVYWAEEEEINNRRKLA